MINFVRVGCDCDACPQHLAIDMPTIYTDEPGFESEFQGRLWDRGWRVRGDMLLCESCSNLDRYNYV